MLSDVTQALEQSGHWVICAPGDPTSEQWSAIHRLAGNDRWSAIRWNTNTGDVCVSIWGADRESFHIIAPSGEER